MIKTVSILLFAVNLFAQGSFITVKNRRFFEWEKEFCFIGFNAYYLQSEAADSARRYIVDDVFKTANEYGVKVIRTWAFYDTDSSELKRAIRFAPYGFNPKGLEALDYVCYKAKQYGIKLILTLSNNYPDFGGIESYLNWWNEGKSTAKLTHSDFFTNDTLKSWFKYYIKTILERENSFTKIKYKNDPAIFSFELMNEASNPGYPTELISSWYNQTAEYFKTIDQNHLLATGEEGYDKFPGSYSDAGLFYDNASYLFNGSKGTSYLQNSQLSKIDYCSIHMYPGLAGFSNRAGKTWIDDHNKPELTQGKPLLPGEMGVKDSKYNAYKYYFDELRKSGVKNCIVWQYLHKDVINFDGFGFNEINSPDIMNLIRQSAQLLEPDSAGYAEYAGETVLYQNYPNPFNPVTTIRYSLKNDCFITLTLFNSLGEKVGVLDEGYKAKGEYERVISIQNQYLASGVYFCYLNAGGKTFTRKIILQK